MASFVEKNVLLERNTHIEIFQDQVRAACHSTIHGHISCLLVSTVYISNIHEENITETLALLLK